jgi:hypothetical protein
MRQDKHVVPGLAGAVLMVLLAAVMPVRAQPAAAGDRLQVEIRQLMQLENWPKMVDVLLKRGDMQKASVQCVQQRYTRELVLERVAVVYRVMYPDPQIVAELNQFFGPDQGEKILAQNLARASAPTGQASELPPLTPAQEKLFQRFVDSEAGKAWKHVQATQQDVPWNEVKALAAEVAAACSR